MTDEEKKSHLLEWRRINDDLPKYIAEGNQCILWGMKVPDMEREDLIAFIGFLDRIYTAEVTQKKSEKK